MSKVIKSALELIGNTPLLQADRYAKKAGVTDANRQQTGKNHSVWMRHHRIQHMGTHRHTHKSIQKGDVNKWLLSVSKMSSRQSAS